MAGGQVLSALAVIASIHVLTGYLAPADYGLMMLMVGTASILAGLAMRSIGDGILVNYSRFRAADEGATFRKAVAGLSVRIVAGVAAATLAGGFLVASIFGLGRSAPLLVAAFLAVEAARFFELMLFTAARRQRAAAFVHVGDAWLRLALSWAALVLFQADAHTAIAGGVAGSLVLLVMVRVAMHPVGLSAPAAGDAARVASIQAETLRLFLGLTPARFLAGAADIGARYAVAAVLGLAAAGIYSACHGLVRRPFGMVNSIGDWTLRPVLAQAVAAQDTARAIRLRLRWLSAIGLVCLAGAALFFLLRRPLVDLLMGERYADAADILPIMAAGIGIFTIANVFNSILIVDGRTKAVFLGNLAGAVSGLGATVVLSWLHGLPGAAMGVVVGSAALAAVAGGAYCAGTRESSARSPAETR